MTGRDRLPHLAWDERDVPFIHRTSARCLIEELDGWLILGPNRNLPAYAHAFERQMTSIQIARVDRRHGWLSLLTPCVQTEGRFEFFACGERKSFCCYKCARLKAGLAPGVVLPSHEGWTPYMLLESAHYLRSHGAPKEPGR